MGYGASIPFGCRVRGRILRRIGETTLPGQAGWRGRQPFSGCGRKYRTVRAGIQGKSGPVGSNRGPAANNIECRNPAEFRYLPRENRPTVKFQPRISRCPISSRYPCSPPGVAFVSDRSEEIAGRDCLHRTGQRESQGMSAYALRAAVAQNISRGRLRARSGPSPSEGVAKSGGLSPETGSDLVASAGRWT